MQPSGAAKAYRKSQSPIFNAETPQFVGTGEGTDNLDFLADLSTLEVINPDITEREDAQPEEGPIPESPAVLLDLLNAESIPYAHCASCASSCKTMSQLVSHYLSEHRVVLQPSCCSPPPVFQTIMGMELQLWQFNFESFSVGPLSLRRDMDFEEAREIIGAHCIVHDDKTKERFVKMPDLQAIRNSFLIHSPELTMIPDYGQGSHEYVQEPTDPVRRLPDLVDSYYWQLRASSEEMVDQDRLLISGRNLLLALALL